MSRLIQRFLLQNKRLRKSQKSTLRRLRFEGNRDRYSIWRVHRMIYTSQKGSGSTGMGSFIRRYDGFEMYRATT